MFLLTWTQAFQQEKTRTEATRKKFLSKRRKGKTSQSYGMWKEWKQESMPLA